MIIKMLEIPLGISFEKKVKLSIIIGSFLFVLGVVIVCLAFAFQNYFINDFMSGFYFGTGGGLGGAGLAIAIYYLRLTKNQEKYKKREIADADERNRFIVTKSGYISFFLIMLLVYKAAIIAGFFNIFVFITLLCVLVLMIIVFLLTHLILRALY
jgi:uncharacterized membrane protein